MVWKFLDHSAVVNMNWTLDLNDVKSNLWPTVFLTKKETLRDFKLLC